jgi:hypothetical protein
VTDDRSRDPDALPSVVRDAIARANVEDGSDAQVARLAGRVGPLLGLSASVSLLPGAAKAAAAPKAGLIAGKLALVKATFAGGMVAGVVGGTIAYRAATASSGEDEPRHTAASSRMVTPGATTKAAPAEVLPPVSRDEPEPTAEAPATMDEPGSRASPEAPRPGRPTPPSAPSATALNEEARLLKRAGALIGSDPSGALSAADEHRHRFPSGALTHERDVLAIRALIALGRRDEAMQRLKRFERTFPSSPHLPRFREMVGEP